MQRFPFYVDLEATSLSFLLVNRFVFWCVSTTFWFSKAFWTVEDKTEKVKIKLSQLCIPTQWTCLSLQNKPRPPRRHNLLVIIAKNGIQQCRHQILSLIIDYIVTLSLLYSFPFPLQSGSLRICLMKQYQL